MPEQDKGKEEDVAAYFDAVVEAKVQAGELRADIEIESSFEINEQQKARIKEWRKEQDAKVAHMQQQSGRYKNDPYMQAMLRRGIPYYGANGGALEYIFVPNSIGRAFIVLHNVTKETLDLSEYDTDDLGIDYSNVRTPWSPPPEWEEAAKLMELEDEEDDADGKDK